MSFSEEELEHDIETMTAEDFEAKYSGVDLEEGMAKRENKLKKNIATTKLGIQKNNFGNPELEKAFARTGWDGGRAYVKGKLQQGRKILRKEEVELGEEREPSPIAGTRLVSTHTGKGGRRHEVRYSKDYNEYQVHHYDPKGKHMGEGPVSYHGDDKEDATISANYHANKVSEDKAPWMGKDLDKPAYQRKAEYEKAKKEGQGGGPALRTAKNEEVEQVDELSKKVYGDYINRASASKSGVAHQIGKINQIAATTGTTPRDREDRTALNKVHANRSKGIGRAVKNLTKGGIDFEEEFELEEKLAGGEKSRQAYAARYTPTGKKKKPEVGKEVEEECASCEEKKLSPKQMKIAKLAGNPNEIDAEDFKKLRKEETERVTPDTLASRNKAVERSIMEIMATNRDLRQEAKIAAFQKNAKSQEKE